MNFLFYGTLRDREILALIAGSDILKKQSEDYQLEGFGCYFVEGEHFPALKPETGASTGVTLYHDLSEQEVKRISLFEGDDYSTQKLNLTNSLTYHYFDFINTRMISGKKWCFESFLEGHKANFLTKVQQWIHTGSWD